MADVKQTYKHYLDYAFYPRSIAVIGASEQPFSFGYHYLRHLIHYGYKGRLYPVSRQKKNVLDIPAYPKLSDVPGDVDLVICCVPTHRVLPLLDECPLKNVKVMHLFTARLSETGRPKAIEMEKAIKLKAQELGVRLIGPNCMGVYCPESGIAFGYNFPFEPGNVGIVFQSGGASTILIGNGMLQGLRFSKVVSYGNGLDITESDILDYLACDAKTEIITGYFEGVRDGDRFVSSLKCAAEAKPVIAIKGGRGQSGTRAVSSHTAAVAGSTDIWSVVFQQAGVIQVKDLAEMANMAMLFNSLPPVTGKRVGIMGGGGGKAVMAADLAEEAGFSVPPLSDKVRSQLKDVVPDIWDWVNNPVDFSIWGDSMLEVGAVPKIFSRNPDFDYLLIQISDENPLNDEMWVNVIKMEADNIANVYKTGLKPVLAVLSSSKPAYHDLENIRWNTISRVRSVLVDAGVPTFDSVAEAVGTMKKYVDYWNRREF
ncbi:MAG: CoA-binding protein [Dehalococcoidia bacterium]|nr:CoA-binding protein [Dehalococcoidia bacterium]